MNISVLFLLNHVESIEFNRLKMCEQVSFVIEHDKVSLIWKSYWKYLSDEHVSTCSSTATTVQMDEEKTTILDMITSTQQGTHKKFFLLSTVLIFLHLSNWNVQDDFRRPIGKHDASNHRKYVWDTFDISRILFSIARPIQNPQQLSFTPGSTNSNVWTMYTYSYLANASTHHWQSNFPF